MKQLNVMQGSPEWAAVRAKHFTASEAAAMMGASKKTSRTELLRMKATGSEKEFSDWAQKNLLDKGHEIEAAARLIVEEMIGETLYPITATDDAGYLLASLDGLTMDDLIGWECKSWNESLAAMVRAGELSPEYYWQLEAQIAVAGMEKIIFTVSDGTPEKTLHMEYRAVPGRAEQLMAGWKQFEVDLFGYEPQEIIPAAVAAPIEDLPALSVNLVGQVTATNLPQWQAVVSSRIQAINTDLKTDEDFATAEKTVKFLDDAEKCIVLVRKQALSQTASIDELFRTLDQISEEMRVKRLNLDRLVKSRKEAIRLEIALEGKTKFLNLIVDLNTRIGQSYMPTIVADFAGVMKSRKTVASLRDAVSTELARVTIEAKAIAEKIEKNLATLRSAGFEFLFPDTAQIVLKANDDLVALIKMRIGEHEKAEAERQRLAAASSAKLIAEDAARTQQQSSPAPEANIPPTSVAPAVAPVPAAVAPISPGGSTANAAVPAIDTGATINLGEINNLLGFMVTAQFLASLGFPAKTEKNAKLYRECEFQAICAAILNHVGTVARGFAMKVAA